MNSLLSRNRQLKIVVSKGNTEAELSKITLIAAPSKVENHNKEGALVVAGPEQLKWITTVMSNVHERYPMM